MKTLGFFALRFAIAFALLAWPWPHLRSTFAAGFRAQVRVVVGVVFPHQPFRVTTFSDPRYPNLDTAVVLAGGKGPGTGDERAGAEIAFDSGSQGWIPLAMLIALSVATPLPWGKRFKAMLAGTLLIQLLVAATILVSVSLALVSGASPAWPRLPLILANHLLAENIWFSFVPPFLLWAGWLAWGGHWKPLGERLTAGL